MAWDTLLAIPLYSLPMMWVYRQLIYWKIQLAEGETLPDTPPLWWRMMLAGMRIFLVLILCYFFFK